MHNHDVFGTHLFALPMQNHLPNTFVVVNKQHMQAKSGHMINPLFLKACLQWKPCNAVVRRITGFYYIAWLRSVNFVKRGKTPLWVCVGSGFSLLPAPRFWPTRQPHFWQITNISLLCCLNIILCLKTMLQLLSKFSPPIWFVDNMWGGE